MNRFPTIYASQETGRWALFDNENDLGILGVAYIQDVAAATWNVIHNLNKLPFLLEFYRFENDGTRVDFKPADVQITNNSISVVNGTPITGAVVIIFADTVIE